MTRKPHADPRERILQVVRSIPRGSVLGYGEIARRAGLPGRARMAAKVLSENNDPNVPWHRVLRSDGRIALPEGSAGYETQVMRLREEGLSVIAGRVRGARPAADIDELIWGPTH